MTPKGFTFTQSESGMSSGGYFASGQFVKSDRKLEIHFRRSLGRVIYHIGSLTLLHEAYMRALLGRNGLNEYPCFSDSPLDGFRHLRSDLANFCGDFLHGSGEEFKQCLTKSRQQVQVTSLKSLPTGGGANRKRRLKFSATVPRAGLLGERRICIRPLSEYRNYALLNPAHSRLAHWGHFSS